MPDERSLREKLEAMANQTASPREAEVARSLLEKLGVPAPKTETARVLTREQILGAPDRPGSKKPVYVRVRYKGTTFILEADEFDMLFGGMPRAEATMRGSVMREFVVADEDQH